MLVKRKCLYGDELSKIFEKCASLIFEGFVGRGVGGRKGAENYGDLEFGV